MTIYISIWRHCAWRCGQFTATVDILVTGNNSPLRNQNKEMGNINLWTPIQIPIYQRESQKRRVNFKLVEDEAKFVSRQDPELERANKKFQINVTTC